MQDATAAANVTAFLHHKDYKFHTTQYEKGYPMVEVYERGQIVIPKYIRDALKISPGTQLNVSLDGRKIVLEQYDPVEELDKIRAKHAVYTTEEVDRLMAKLEKKKLAEVMKDVH